MGLQDADNLLADPPTTLSKWVQATFEIRPIRASPDTRQHVGDGWNRPFPRSNQPNLGGAEDCAGRYPHDGMRYIVLLYFALETIGDDD